MAPPIPLPQRRPPLLEPRLQVQQRRVSHVRSQALPPMSPFLLHQRKPPLHGMRQVLTVEIRSPLTPRWPHLVARTVSGAAAHLRAQSLVSQTVSPTSSPLLPRTVQDHHLPPRRLTQRCQLLHQVHRLHLPQLWDQLAPSSPGALRLQTV